MKEFEIKLIDNQEYIKLSDLYIWTINRMDKLSLEEQKHTIENLKEIVKLKPCINCKEVAEIFIKNAIHGILTKTMPLDPMSLSYLVYRCKEVGADPQKLADVIDANGETIVMEFFNYLNK